MSTSRWCRLQWSFNLVPLTYWTPQIQQAMTGLENQGKCCTVACRTNLEVLSQPAIRHKWPCSSLGSGKVLVVDLCGMSFGSRAQGDWASCCLKTNRRICGLGGCTRGTLLSRPWMRRQGHRRRLLMHNSTTSVRNRRAMLRWTATWGSRHTWSRLRRWWARSSPAMIPTSHPRKRRRARPLIDLGVPRHIHLTRHSHTCRVSATRYTGRGHRWGLASCSTCHLRVEQKTRRRRRERKSQSCVSNRGTAQRAKSRWGAHSSTWCWLPWGSGHVKARSTRVTRAHTRGHWWTRPGRKARVATAARTQQE